MTACRNESRRDFLKKGALAASLFRVPRALWAQSREAREVPVVLRCIIMSDIHYYGSTDNEEVARFYRAMKRAYAYADGQPYKKLDAAMIVGDMTDNGNEKQLDLFLKSVEETFRDETTLLPCMGNHEFWPGPKALWEKKFGMPANNVHEINGYRFIGVSPEKGTMKEGDYLYAVDWLEKELAEANEADPNKPIFVFQHYPVARTIYGARDRDNCGVKDLYPTLAKYPNVVDFAGHSHFLMGDPRVVWQGAFTAFGTSTLHYAFFETLGDRFCGCPLNRFSYSEFYIMEVCADHSITVMPYDNFRGRFFDYAYRVAAPSSDESRPYTDERYKTAAAPIWDADAKLRVIEAREDRVDVEIPQASCPDVVHSYQFELERRDRDGEWRAVAPQYFSSQYYDRDMPPTIRASVEGLDPATRYRAKATALNPFQRPSDRALSLEFETAPEPDGIDRSAPTPDANFFDVRVVDGKIVNAARNPGKALEIFGAPKVARDEATGTDAILLDGEGSCMKIACDALDIERLRIASFAARFKSESKRESGRGVLLGSTEGRGATVYVDYKGKRVGFIASIGSRWYSAVDAPITPDEWHDVVAVYDGYRQILFVDGKEAAAFACRGFLSYPREPREQAIFIGADVARGGEGNDFFEGRIERAQVFSWALKAEQIAALAGR